MNNWLPIILLILCTIKFISDMTSKSEKAIAARKKNIITYVFIVVIFTISLFWDQLFG